MNREISLCALLFAAGAIWSPLVIDGFANAESTISMVSNIATTIGVAVAIYVGLRGLHAWRMQMIHGQNRDLAMRTLLALENAISGIKLARSPIVIPEEVEEHKAKNLDFLKTHNLGVIKAYERRWKLLEDLFEKLQSCASEAFILWKGETVLPANLKKLQTLKTNLFLVTQNYLLTLHPSYIPERHPTMMDRLESERGTLYDFDDNDTFNSELRKIKDDIHNHLSQYLK